MTAPGEAHLKEPKESESPGQGAGPTDRVLRAKYLDYCSARVAEMLLQLTADEMYVLAQDAAKEREAEDAEPLSYTKMVQLATNRISRKLSLPDFSTWVEAYERDPQRYEKEMLGLWETDVKTSDRSID